MAYLEDIFSIYSSFVKNKQSHLICSLRYLDTELYFCVKIHKELFLWCPGKASSDKASGFLCISPSAEPSSIMNNVWWPFNVFLNILIHSFNFPSTSQITKTFLSWRIHFLDRYVLLSKIVGHKIMMHSKWFLYMLKIRSYCKRLHQRTLHYEETLGGSYI